VKFPGPTRHIAENSLAIDHEFREGNAAPAARNLEFVQACERKMPKGKRIKAVRADSAAYQADVFNYCEETHKVFAIGVDQDAAVKAVIAAISEGEWKTFRDGEIAETVHCMNKTDKAFRLIVLRRPRQQDLFEDKSLYRYHAIASNRSNEDAAVTMEWYSQRGDASENRIKDLKVGFGMEYMPCGSFQANAVFFAIGVLTYNLYLGFSLRCAWKRMGAFASADRALAVVSDRGQDRAPRPADFLADRRRHVGHVRRDPRAVRAHHAGRRRHSGDVVIPGAGPALGKPNDEPPPAYLCLKPSRIPADGQKIARRAG
jgi:Transposase DDE domain.